MLLDCQQQYFRTKPLGFELGSQQAWIDNDWKLVRNGAQGQCATMLPPYSSGHGEYVVIFE